jgi:hypothetical protein
MPDLRRVLADHDLALLRLIAELWASCWPRPASAMPWTNWPAYAPARARARRGGRAGAEAQTAFEALARPHRQPLAQPSPAATVELRAMGPARRDREKPWANAPPPPKRLWYRGLLGGPSSTRATGWKNTSSSPMICARWSTWPPTRPRLAPADPPGHPLPPLEGLPPDAPTPTELPTGEDVGRWQAADDAVTLLAYLQVITVRPEAPAAHAGLDAPPQLPARHTDALARYLRLPEALPLYLTLLPALKLADSAPHEPYQLDPDHVQPFLQAAPAARLRALAEGWRDARDWNDLRHVPGLVFEGTGWRNDPHAARQAVLALLAGVPPGVWWSTAAFVAAVHERRPDFQRPAGDYDSWYIRAANGAYLRGFENWDRVDGALVRWLIGQPLRWLGLVAVTPPDANAEPGFRLTPYGAALLGRAGWDAEPDSPPPPAALEPAPTGLVRVPAAAPPTTVFNSPASAIGCRLRALQAAWSTLPPLARRPGPRRQEGHHRPAHHPVPRARAAGHRLPALSAALRRWEHRGPEAVLLDTVVLRVSNADLLEILRRTPACVSCWARASAPPPWRAPRARRRSARRAGRLGILATANCRPPRRAQRPKLNIFSNRLRLVDGHDVRPRIPPRTCIDLAVRPPSEGGFGAFARKVAWLTCRCTPTR